MQAATRLCSICLAFFLLMTWPNLADAIVIDVNRTQGQAILPNLSTNRYSGVGYIGGCTATPVSKDLIVTAAHCIGVNDTRKYFYLAYDDEPNVKVFGDVVTYPGYDRNVEGFDQRHVPDLAVIRLDEKLPDYVRIYKMASMLNPVGAPVELVGYGRTGDGFTGAIANSKSVGLLLNAYRLEEKALTSCPAVSRAASILRAPSL